MSEGKRGGVLCLLVIASQRINYYDVFRNCTLHKGKLTIEVEQVAWDDILAVSYGGAGGVVCTLMPSSRPLPGTPQNTKRTFKPDFVLFRGSTRGDANVNHYNKLLAFAHAGIPSVNSIDSFVRSQEKPLLYGKLLELQRKYGKSRFPLIEQSFYPNFKSMFFLPSFPNVVKIGTASGGLGKMKLEHTGQWDDFVSMSAMQTNYITSEPFIDWDWDLRIQKIGTHYRCFRRSRSGSWKVNSPMSQFHDEDIELEERFKFWIDVASEALNLGICAIDAVQRRGKDGQAPDEYILEVNSSAIGLNSRHEEEDSKHIRELVLLKMAESFPMHP